MASIKILSLVHRIQFEDFIGRGITTVDLEMATGYRGRGLPGQVRVIPAGTPVTIKVRPAYSNDPHHSARWELSTDLLDCGDGRKSQFICVKFGSDYDEFKRSFIAKHPLNQSNPMPPKPYFMEASQLPAPHRQTQKFHTYRRY